MNGLFRLRVVRTAVDCGFKLKPQPNGTNDLHEYVYTFAEQISRKAPDKYVEMNREQLLQRSIIGQHKYGVTLETSPEKVEAWAQHAIEEALDFANYLQVFKDKVRLDNLFFEHVADFLDTLGDKAPAQFRSVKLPYHSEGGMHSDSVDTMIVKLREHLEGTK